LKIGIIGQGFVGSAIREGLKNYYSVMTYDKNPSVNSNSSISQICSDCEIIFVCVPTPMRKSGECDTRILRSAIIDLDSTCKKLRKRPTVVIKSTIPPGTTAKINSEVSIDVCFSPEFLTEANSFDDFKNQTRVIIGGSGARKVKSMFRKPFPDIPIVVTKSETAEMVKYFINCFLSAKVTFSNQMYDICQAANIDYDKVCEYALLDNRIGKTHLAVPGPDGDRGFGGHCFPKDLTAMKFHAKKLNVNDDFLNQISLSNENYRNNKDWLEMKGRAVADD
jgi:UDPglucose 6-dehydrogenase